MVVLFFTERKNVDLNARLETHRREDGCGDEERQKEGGGGQEASALPRPRHETHRREDGYGDEEKQKEGGQEASSDVRGCYHSRIT